MPENQPKKRGRPSKMTQTLETNSVSNASLPIINDDNNKYEFNSMNAISVSSAVFGLDIFSICSPETIINIIQNPMTYNDELRRLSNRLYSANGLLTQCIDYCTSMPTLDFVVIPHGESKQKKKKNKELMISTLKQIRHKELARDDLFKDMVDGIAFYYFETTNTNDMKKTMNDYDVENVLELNELGINAAIIPLPTEYTRIVGRKNSSPVLAFNMRYFEGLAENELNRKLRLYPKEIRDRWQQYNGGANDGNNWLVLDNTKTICTKVRSKIEERWGRPLCLAAIKDILYGDYFKDTLRNTLNNSNSDVYVQYFPQGREPGSCALTKTQQEVQHNTVKNAILNKNHKNSTSFVSVASGTKIDHLERDLSILDEKNSSYIDNQIGLDLGFMANLLTGVGSGNYAAQQNNLQLLLSEILMWLEPFTDELVKVINENIIKDKKNPVGLYYLPCSHITRQDFTQNMKDLYLNAGGSRKLWVASTGINPEAYFTILDEEVEENFEEKYPPHQTSYTLSAKSSDGSESKAGRPEKLDATNDQTLQTRANGGNDMPKPSVD